MAHLYCRTTAAYASGSLFSILQFSFKLRMKAAAVVYVIIRNFEYLFLDFLRVFLIIQAEILP